MNPKVLCLLWIFYWPVSAFGGVEEIKVRVFSKHSFHQIEIFAEGIRLKAPSSAVAGSFQETKMSKIVVRTEGDKVKLEALPALAWIEASSSSGPLTVKIDGISPRKFSGSLRIESRGPKLFVFNAVPIEDYVRGVLGSELPGDFPLEAQKAQAILVRTYALAERGRHAAEGFDFCDLTHCQVYAGVPAASGKQAEAVRVTQGRILSYQGKPAAALFHSTCGGHTSPNQRVFGGRPLPYLQGVSDGEYCAASPHSKWESRIPLEQIAVLLEAGGSPPFRGEVTSIRPQESEPQGRVFSVELMAGQRVVFPTMDFLSWIGKTLGWNELKSNWFEVEMKDKVAHFKGRGLGHGVGLCQWGAKGRAEAGMKFPAILQGYFPGTRVERRSQ